MIIKGIYNNAKVLASVIEEEATQQIQTLCNQKWNEGNQIVIMPDVHAGKGCTIGTTIQINNGKVCPNLVGVDIGCGMLCITIPKKIILDLQAIDDFIHANIPSGFNIQPFIQDVAKEFKNELMKLHCLDHIKVDYVLQSLGTLGGGNHFIEIDEDGENKYLVIHTGSRHLGVEVATYYQQKAIENCSLKDELNQLKKELIQKLKAEGRQKEITRSLKELAENYLQENAIPQDLCYLSGNEAKNYFEDMAIVTQYASLNRKIIADKIMTYITGNNDYECFETIHNYIDFSNNQPILRKGAIATYKDQKVLIPINMKDGSIIAIGKGNPEFNYSGPHGAGRLMSRTKAMEMIQLEDYQKAMEGIYSTSINKNTIDESPFAYKSLNDIIHNIQDIVEDIQMIHPIYNFKAS